MGCQQPNRLSASILILARQKLKRDTVSRTALTGTITLPAPTLPILTDDEIVPAVGVSLRAFGFVTGGMVLGEGVLAGCLQL